MTPAEYVSRDAYMHGDGMRHAWHAVGAEACWDGRVCVVWGQEGGGKARGNRAKIHWVACHASVQHAARLR